jgi:peptidoglycan/LPS O-acetylase OafA/YrhL
MIGFLDLCLGGLAVITALVAAVAVPAASQRSSVEPEELYALMIVFVLAAVVGSAGVSAGQRLLRGARDRQQTVWAGRLSLIAAILLVAASVIGFVDEQPSSYELRYLLLPAAIFVLSAHLLREPSRMRKAP